MSVKLWLAEEGDWQELWVGNACVTFNHRLDVLQVLEAVLPRDQWDVEYYSGEDESPAEIIAKRERCLPEKTSNPFPKVEIPLNIFYMLLRHFMEAYNDLEEVNEFIHELRDAPDVTDNEREDYNNIIHSHNMIMLILLSNYESYTKDYYEPIAQQYYKKANGDESNGGLAKS